MSRKILIIDDEVDLVDMMKFQLKTKGYEVETASNGLEGLERLKTFEPALIILDINMPKMGGLEFLNKISTSHGRTRFPVLVLTARANLEQVFKDIDVEGFMPKPFEIDSLLKEVERISSGKARKIVFLLDLKENPNAQQICRRLADERFEVFHEESAPVWQEKMKKRKPDCVIMEYMQPDMSGEEAIKKIKEITQRAPVIVYTYSGFDYCKKSLDAGADKYLGKPADYDCVISSIKELTF